MLATINPIIVAKSCAKKLTQSAVKRPAYMETKAARAVSAFRNKLPNTTGRKC
jgi:hypothetical protein